MVVLVFTLVCALYGCLVWLAFGDWGRSGVFGDSFGALTSFFTGLAFVALVLSHLSQQRDLDRSIEAQKRAAQTLALGVLFFSWQKRLEVAETRSLRNLAEALEVEMAQIVTELKSVADDGSWFMNEAK
ncbi:MAG: hypothetical protein ACREKH_13375 [Candidatus Rokuibacteriota bacterium]